jgi:manganese/iron transport system permease protein
MLATIFSPLIDPLSEPAFVRALIDVSVVAVVAGIVGTFIVLRGTGFLGDALAHAIFPGVVIAFLIEASLLGGALVAGLLTAVMMGLLTANTRVRGDSAIGVVFTAAFAIGVILISHETIEGEELEHILFGDPLNASWRDVITTLVIGGGVAGTVLLLRRLFVVAAFDPSGARAMGLPVIALDVLLLALTALTVVIAFKAVGNILVIALLITPAAAARLLTDRLVPTMMVASVIGVTSGVVGTYIGWHADVSVGGTIVLTSTAVFFLAWLAAPKHGILGNVLARREAARSGDEPEAEAEMILASRGIREPHEA